MNRGKFHKKTIIDVPLDGKTVLVRTDYNVPLNENGEIADDYRIRSSLPTLTALLERGCMVVICSHLGRPDGKVVPALSLRHVALRLAELLSHPVTFVPATVGDAVRLATKKATSGEVIMLENLRFYAEEEANDAAFAEQLANDSSAAYFVQDGFGVVHRAHASTSAIAQYLPSVAGLLLIREYQTITEVIQNPKRPMIAVLGGAKISDKIKIVQRFVQIADKVIIGGAMANTFLHYRKYPVGMSKYEEGLETTLDAIYAAAIEKVGKDAVDDFILLPTDVAVADRFEKEVRRSVVDRRDVSKTEIILDIGTNTMDEIDREIATAATVVWNGTLGMAEWPQFAHGSARLALALASRTEVVSVIGGGDTADFVLHWDASAGASFTHVSTGGGASLELMSGEPMPGVDALMDA